MTEPPRRPLDAWPTDAPGPFVTIRASGPLEGIVTLTAIEGGHGRTLIEPRWTQDGGMQSDSLKVDSYEQARTVAAAAEMATGHVPDLARDWSA